MTCRPGSVLVVGPALAGTSGVARVLRRCLPDRRIAEATDPEPGPAPGVVVFVVSAVAPLTESDAAQLDAAAAGTDAVIGVVAKIDAHHRWREVLSADRELIGRYRPRYRTMAWVGVAAAPDFGEPVVAQLVAELSAVLADPRLPHRNELRIRHTRLAQTIAGLRDASAHGRDRITALRAARDELLLNDRRERAQRSIAVRSRPQQLRVQLSQFARNRCAAVCGELQRDVAGLGRRGLGGMAAQVSGRCAEVAGEVDDAIARAVGQLAAELRLPVPPPPDRGPLDLAPGDGPAARSRALEARLTVLLGAGFGLGAGLAAGRLLAALVPGQTAAALAGGAVFGLALTAWVVGIRGLLHERAVHERWIAEVTAALRASAEQRVAICILAAEAVFHRELIAAGERERARLAGRIGAVDAELAALVAEAAVAAERSERELPILLAEAAALGAELAGHEQREKEGF